MPQKNKKVETFDNYQDAMDFFNRKKPGSNGKLLPLLAKAKLDPVKIAKNGMTTTYWRVSW